MAQITSTAEFSTTLAPDAVRERVIDWAKGYTYKLEVDEPGRLVAYTGSQVKMRLLGGGFIAASSLPTRTTVEITPAGAGSSVTVQSQDSVGLGVKTGMKGKYQRWTAEITEAIRAACAADAPAG